MDEVDGCCGSVSLLLFPYSIAAKLPYSFLETLHTGFVFRELYHYSVSAIQNPLVIDQIDWYVSSTLSSLCIRR